MELIINNIKSLARQTVLLPRLLTVLFSILSILAIFQAITNLKDIPNSSQIDQPIVRPLSSTSPQLMLSQLHLFGEYKGDLNSLPETLLQLTLQGIALSTDPSLPSRAIISSQGGQTKVYRIGETVPGGAIIKDIRKDLVVLEENNQLESLKLPIPTLPGGIYTSASQG